MSMLTGSSNNSLQRSNINRRVPDQACLQLDARLGGQLSGNLPANIGDHQTIVYECNSGEPNERSVLRKASNIHRHIQILRAIDKEHTARTRC
jgi:hypothetical protein